MEKSIYIASINHGSGKTAICLGLIHSFRKLVNHIGFFKPLGQRYEDTKSIDIDVELIKEIYQLKEPLETMNPFSLSGIRDYFVRNKQDELLFKIKEIYDKISKNNDIIIIEGTDCAGMASTFELDINADIVKSLNAKVILVCEGKFKDSIDEIVSELLMSENSFKEKDCDFIGVILNKVEEHQRTQILNYIPKFLEKRKIKFFGAFPDISILPKPTMEEIARKTNAEVIYGKDFLFNIPYNTIIAAMEPRNALKHIRENTLIITPGDREDILLAAMCSQISSTCPNISGMILTGGLQPDNFVKKLISGVGEFRIPILSVKEDTFTTGTIINNLSITIRAKDKVKIYQINKATDKYIDVSLIHKALQIKKIRKATPQDFLDKITESATEYNKHIVLPEGPEERNLRAADKILQLRMADITLIGNKERISDHAKELGVNISDANIVDPSTFDKIQEYGEIYYELRKHKKGVTLENAVDQMKDPVYLGTMMVYNGEADGLVSGAIHSTGDTIRPALQIIKAKPGLSVVSSIFFICLEEKVLVYGDCAVVTDPNAEELADIAITSAETAKAFGIEPYVAFLSYATGKSAVGPSVEKVINATQLSKQKRPDLPIEGPIQYDAALEPDVAKIKMPESKVAGRATVFIFPDLDSGNIAYKAVQRSANALAVGPILQGLNKPVNDLSRGCTPDEIVYTVAITACQAHYEEKKKM